MMSFKTTITAAISALPLLAASVAPALSSTHVEIYTTDNRAGSGTDSNVWLKIFGPKGETRRIRLQDSLSGDILEGGDVDMLFLGDDIGPAATKVEIESDGRYPGSDWHLEKIITYTGPPQEVSWMTIPSLRSVALASGKVITSTFVYDDWIKGGESFAGETAGRSKPGVQLTRKESVAKADGSGEDVATKVYVIMMSDGLHGGSPVAVSTVHEIKRSESMAISDKTANAVKAGVKAGVSYSNKTATGGKVRVSASVSVAYEWAKEQSTERTWSTENSTTTEDKFAAKPGEFEFRILESNGTVTIQNYKSLLSNENFVVSYLRDASSFSPRGVTFPSGVLADDKWNLSVAQPLAVARGEAEYNSMVSRFKKFGILKSPMSYAAAMN